MDQLFRDYKVEEGKKILQIVHVCIAISSAALINGGVSNNSGLLVLAILGNSLTYAYWYFSDVAVYWMQAKLQTNIDVNSELKSLQSSCSGEAHRIALTKKLNFSHEQYHAWKSLQLSLQIKCFAFSVSSWVCAISGLVFLYVTDSEIVSLSCMLNSIGISVVSGAAMVIWDYCKIVKLCQNDAP